MHGEQLVPGGDGLTSLAFAVKHGENVEKFIMGSSSPERASSPMPMQSGQAGSPEHISFRKYTNSEGKNIAVLHLHCGIHHRIRNGFDVLRSLVITLYQAFDLETTDDQVLNERLKESLNHAI